MDSQILEEILGSNSLPSLPGVAVRVLELTSDPNVSLEELARLIRNDQALSAKILQTVNSSFYGLRQRCSSIQKALGLLGLNPVKSLVLGFSLVVTVDGQEDDEFDYRSYWRRALFGALGARAFAEAKRLPQVEEAFLAGLFQDIGMIAMRSALGRRYLDVLQVAAGDHARLPRLEFDAFEVTHATVGALLAEHWRLPSELGIPIRYHESPTAAPSECSQIVRCVALGNMVLELLDATEPAQPLRRLYARAHSWMAMSALEVDEIVTKIGEWTREAAKLFSVDAGQTPDAPSVLRRAERRLVEIRQDGQFESYAERNFESVLQSSQERDGLTGAMGRDGFVAAIREGAPVAVAGDAPITVVQIMLEGLGAVTEKHGAHARDEVLLGVVSQLHTLFEPMGGIVCRLSESIFGVVLPGTARAPAVLAAERFRSRFSESVPFWINEKGMDTAPVRLSAGVASIDNDTAHAIRDAESLLRAVQDAVKAARSASGSRVCAYSAEAA
ncbi:MAG: HDOD domain-containing protein [Phycisphaerales bacterium]